jgi:hypothetical protein
MKYIKEFKLFESIDDNDKYLLNLSSANSMIDVEGWLNNSPRITDKVKADAERSWSLYAVLNKITLPNRLRRLSNKELTNEIKISNDVVRALRIREEYDDVCKELLPDFHRLFKKFKRLSIDKKVEFMRELEFEGYTFCRNGDIIKIINKKDLKEEMEMISDKFEYFCLYPV